MSWRERIRMSVLVWACIFVTLFVAAAFRWPDRVTGTLATVIKTVFDFLGGAL
ncbi:hypothetical protein [Marinihelvus fidelis]|uniref:hypothetical protein n=1 Tax=Marinihelvus fidelis TaxID=2613842 RepID=UPI0017800BD4|nr:hypothetical protein [Marinihelvus fidelis]